MLLRDKVALITGAAAGIGQETARLFAAEGASVLLLDRDGKGAEAEASSIRGRGGSALAFAADVRDAAALGAAARGGIERFGHIDILINNAGIYPRRAFLDMTEAEWDEMLAINLTGVFRCTKAVLPHMVERGAGKIVNISSVTFFKGMANLSHYVATKGGVIGLTRSLAREMGPRGVYVNCITPGAIEVETEKLVATPAQMAAIVEQQSLPRRLGPLDVARVCLFLSSSLSDGMTGQTVNVDGGLVMY
jgi:3-oxoacyl-[acyl-carrier protein] reductase